MGKRVVTEEEFIERARKIHGDRYDYSSMKWEGLSSKSKLRIFCHHHGFFEQAAAKHLQGQRCRECWRSTLTPRENFVKKAKSVHGEAYSYDKLPATVRMHDSYEAGCKRHGVFKVIPYLHLTLQRGCPSCSHAARVEKESPQEALPLGYSYRLLENFKGGITLMEVGCFLHGSTERSFSSIIKHYACRGCYEQSLAEKMRKSEQTRIAHLLALHGEKWPAYGFAHREGRLQVSCLLHGITLRAWREEPVATRPCGHCLALAPKRYNLEPLLQSLGVELSTRVSYGEGAFTLILPRLHLALELKPPLRKAKTVREREAQEFNAASYGEHMEAKARWARKLGFKLIVLSSREELEVLLNYVPQEEKRSALVAKKPQPAVVASFSCSQGHAIASARASCSYCTNRKVLCGFNDFGCRHPELLEEWAASNVLKPHEVVYGSNSKVTWRCKERGHTWSAPVASRHRGSGCRDCYLERVEQGSLALRGKLSLEEHSPALAGELVDRSLGNELSFSSHRRVRWLCPEAHGYELSPNERLQGRGCPYCHRSRLLPGFNDIAGAAPELLQELAQASDATLPSWERRAIGWRHRTPEGVLHEWEQSPAARIQGRAGCLICTSRLLAPGVNDVATTHPEVAAQWSVTNELSPREVMRGSNVLVDFICPAGHSWRASVKSATAGKRSCGDCRDTRTFRSRGEEELLQALQELAPKLTVETNVRRFKGQGLYELDIFLPELKLAFDFNGIYWHGEQFKGVGYHEDKRAAAQEAGLTLFEVWEDHWSLRRAEVLAALSEALRGELPALLRGRSDYS